MPSNILETIDRLKQQLDALRPLPPEVTGRVEQKLRIESNYHSNALEGNTLTLGETRSLLLHGLTARGKPMREHLDIEGYDRAIKELARMAREDHPLSESFICNLHRVLLNEPYEVETIAADGRNTRRAIAVGAYKSTANNIVTSTGETYYFTPPEQVRHAMRELIDWYQALEKEGEHPIISAAIFHYRFVRIHPFDDGNGRMARLLMNRILLQHGYPLAIVRRDTRARYLQELERADQTEDPGQFIDYIASCCEYPLNLYLRAARGQPIEDTDDIDREIALFRHTLVEGTGSARSRGPAASRGRSGVAVLFLLPGEIPSAYRRTIQPRSGFAAADLRPERRRPAFSPRSHHSSRPGSGTCSRRSDRIRFLRRGLPEYRLDDYHGHQEHPQATPMQLGAVDLLPVTRCQGFFRPVRKRRSRRIAQGIQSAAARHDEDHGPMGFAVRELIPHRQSANSGYAIYRSHSRGATTAGGRRVRRPDPNRLERMSVPYLGILLFGEEHAQQHPRND